MVKPFRADLPRSPLTQASSGTSAWKVNFTSHTSPPLPSPDATGRKFLEIDLDRTGKRVKVNMMVYAIDCDDKREILAEDGVIEVTLRDYGKLRSLHRSLDGASLTFLDIRSNLRESADPYLVFVEAVSAKKFQSTFSSSHWSQP